MWLALVKMKWILHVSEKFSRLTSNGFFYPYHINWPASNYHTQKNSCIIKYIGPWKKENILRNVGHSLHTYMADAVLIHCIRSTWKIQILNNLRVYPTGNNYLLCCKKCGTGCLWSYTDTIPSSEFCHYTKGVIRVLICLQVVSSGFNGIVCKNVWIIDVLELSCD